VDRPGIPILAPGMTARTRLDPVLSARSAAPQKLCQVGNASGSAGAAPFCQLSNPTDCGCSLMSAAYQ
jgi:hypothetical protein